MITDLLTLERPLVAIDLETTGLSSRYDRICSIGLVKVYPDGRVTEWSSIVDPGVDISEEVSAVHHITNDMVIGEPTFKDIAPILYTGINQCDLLGYNAMSFDVKFLVAEFARCNYKYVVPRVIDSFKIYTRFHPRNLKNAVKYYLDEDLDNAHSAPDDAKAALRVFRAQLVRHPELPRSVQELHDIFFTKNSLDPDGKVIWTNNEACINFGKHKGQPLSKIPKHYLKWLANDAETSDEIKVIMKDAIQGKYPVKEDK